MPEQMASAHFANSARAAFALQLPLPVSPISRSARSSVLPIHWDHFATHARLTKHLENSLLLVRIDFRVELNQIFFTRKRYLKVIDSNLQIREDLVHIRNHIFGTIHK